MQLLCNHVFHCILKYRHDSMIMKPPQCKSLILSEHDLNVLRYLAGYAIYKLIKFFQKYKNNPAALVTLSLLDEWKGSHPNVISNVNTFTAYTQEWVNRLDRGHLTLVSDTIFALFCKIECVGKAHLDINQIKVFSTISVNEMCPI